MEKGANSRASSGHSYDVFLSFRGPDTRHKFTDCLYHDMTEAGILVYRDTESLPVGEKISALLPAIENSKIYIPIFSTTYASSPWCLRELAHMVDCTLKSNENKKILPIFLDVEPDDVKLRPNELKPNLYIQALLEHQKQEKFSTEVESWEKALIEVGKIRGWNWQEHEGQGVLIRSVFHTVLVELKVLYEKVTKDLVGVEDRVEAIIQELDLKSDKVRFLGIHGIGGVGKTTLAKVVFNRLLSSFHGCCFLADVGESSRRNGVVHLQKQLLSKLLGSRSVSQILGENDAINMMERGVLRNKKFLIVLDNVDEKKQLRNLAEKGDWFGSGSRIIITIRDQSLLKIEEEATEFSTYEVREMKFDHALKLFSRHAFRSDFPPSHRVSWSETIVHILGMLPLALEVTGSSLNGKSQKIWGDTLKKLQIAPPKEVQDTLMITYEMLDTEQRHVFLDIACFFVNMDKTYPLYMWDDCEYYPHNAIEVLFLMSFVKVKDDNTFWMHDQVRDLGRGIVRREDTEHPYKRSRVWKHEEAIRILKRKEGSSTMKALSLGHHEDKLTRDEFDNYPDLRFFQGDGVFLVGDFNNLLPSLRWLSWQNCPCKSEEFVANFPWTELLVLDLSCSDITDEWVGWSQIKAASKLKALDLSKCKYLTRMPDLSTLESLERLNLEGCHNLIEIDPSIGKLQCLTALNLNGCQSLQELPEVIGCLKALTEIVMPDTPDKFRLPETFGNLKSLLTLDVSHRQISKLPYSIGGLDELRRLSLYQCTKIKELPESVGKLKSLVELDLSWTSIFHLPDSIGNLKQLKVLRMSHISGMTKLPSVIGKVEKLEELDASNCWNLIGEVPEEIGSLSYLRILNLSDTRISGLPNSIGSLKQLKVLRISHMRGITRLPKAIGLAEKLEELDARGCRNLTGEIPEEIGKLSYLRILDLSDTRISGLPTTVSGLSNLQTLNLELCLELEKLPELPRNLTCLRGATNRHGICAGEYHCSSH
ncbi:disease resistance protein RPV1-like [Rhodamnia argentea]|uniref:Disease resistance protein RPV1-like n=1 Tax=Rhodamnia argentea TaxID=178133 RepID=A0ABM3HJZ6_9MYRT|nr:disease resistance protein RPV1-like [Rhodamnia argentea]